MVFGWVAGYFLLGTEERHVHWIAKEKPSHYADDDPIAMCEIGNRRVVLLKSGDELGGRLGDWHYKRAHESLMRVRPEDDLRTKCPIQQ